MNKTKSSVKILSLLMALLMFSSVAIIPASAASAPAAPKTVTSAQNTSAIKLTWSKVSGATGYAIYYKLPGDISWRTGVKSTTATSHTFKGLPAGQSYTFAVRSYTVANGKTTMGGYKEIKTATQTNAPKNLKATQSTSAIKLTWSEVPEATGYKIFYKTSASAAWKTAVSSTKATSHTFSNLAAGKKYIFAVRSYATSSFGTFLGKYSTVETATKPATPTSKASSTTSSITLSWSKVNADGYRIYYKSGSSDWKTAVSSTTATSYTWKNLGSGKTYSFAVKAYVKTSSGVIWGGYKQINATTQSNAAVPSTKAEIATAYNKAVNNLKAYTGTVKVTQTDNIQMEVVNVPSSASSIINSNINALLGEQPTKHVYTFKNGVDINESYRRLYDKITPYGKAASLKASGIASASATKNSNGGYTMKITLISETMEFDGNTSTGGTHNKSVTDPLDFALLDLGSVSVKSAETSLPKTTLTATVDAKGRLTSLTVSLPLQAAMNAKAAAISLAMSINGKIDTNYKMAY